MTHPELDALSRPLLVWSLTTGEAGLRQQARGLAKELSPDAQERIVEVSRLAALAPPNLFARTMAGIRAIQGDLGPTWPDVLISCGRRAGLASMAIRRRSGASMVAVHIQQPSLPEAFDLVIAMPHDQVQGRNVIKVDTALHGLRRPALQEAAQKGDPRFAAMPRPWTAVLLGGPTGSSRFAPDDAQRLAVGLDQLRAQIGGSLLITPSRRTPASVIAALALRYKFDTSVFIWDSGGENPYMTILACADTIVVTSDSISMISEALATTAEVRIFDIGVGDRHTRFLQGLLSQRLVTPLGEAPPPMRREPIDATPQIADVVREIIRSKLGVEA